MGPACQSSASSASRLCTLLTFTHTLSRSGYSLHIEAFCPLQFLQIVELRIYSGKPALIWQCSEEAKRILKARFVILYSYYGFYITYVTIKSILSHYVQ